MERGSGSQTSVRDADRYRNSGLNQMYDFVACFTPGLDRPWGQETPPKFIEEVCDSAMR